jgi:hypothetical protein
MAQVPTCAIIAARYDTIGVIAYPGGGVAPRRCVTK